MFIEIVWFSLWGILWGIYFILDGFDLGLGTLMPFIAKEEKEKIMLKNAIGPVWNGNEVWLITAGGVTFAAFPKTYAVMFSTLYAPLMLILFALILRGVSFEFRALSSSNLGRKVWDTCLFIGSAAPALLFGVAFANIFHGIPFDAQGVYHGTLLTLLNPYGLLGGVLFVLMFCMHGALWLASKTEDGPLHDRADAYAKALWPLALAAAVGFLVFSHFAANTYANYLRHPWMFGIPLLAVAGLLAVRLFIAKGDWLKAWAGSALFIFAGALTGVGGIFPNLYPSSLNPAFSLSIHNSASTPMTLKIMLAVALVFVPIVIIYQAWTYRLFGGKVSDKDITYDH